MSSENLKEAPTESGSSMGTPYSPMQSAKELNAVSVENLPRRPSNLAPKKAVSLKKIIMISGFASIANQRGRYSLPSSKNFAILKENVLFLIPLVQSQPTNAAPIKKMLKAEQIALHPEKNIIATFSTDPHFIFQVFDIENKCRLSKINLDAPPLFFRWIQNYQLIILTHHFLAIVKIPKKEEIITDPDASQDQLHPMFDLFDEVKTAKAILRIDLDHETEPQWILLVTGNPLHNPSEGPPVYLHQLFSVKRDASQPVQAEHVRLESTDKGLLLFLVNSMNSGRIITIIPVRDTNSDEQGPKIVRLTVDIPADDYVIHMHVFKKSEQFYIFTKQGWVLLYRNNELVIKEQMFQNGVYVITTLPHNDSQILLLDSSGMIFKLIYSDMIANPSFASTPAISYGSNAPPNANTVPTLPNQVIPQQGQRFDLQLLCTLLEARRPDEAARQASQMYPFQWTLVQDFIDKDPASKNDLTISFLVSLCQYRALNEEESLALCMASLELRTLPSIGPLLEVNRLTYSDAIGDLLSIFETLIPYALKAYKFSKSYKKAIDLMADQGMFAALVEYIKETNFPARDMILLSRMIGAAEPEVCEEYACLVAKTNLNDHRAIEWIQNLTDLLLKLPTQKEAIRFLKKFIQDEPDFATLQDLLISLLAQSDPKSIQHDLKQYSHYNFEKAAYLCIEKGLYKCAVSVITESNQSSVYTRIWYHIFETKNFIPSLGDLSNHLNNMVVLLSDTESELWTAFIEKVTDVEATLEALIIHERLDLLLVLLQSVFKSSYKNSKVLSTLYLLVIMLSGTSEDISKVLADPRFTYHPQLISKYLINLGHFEEAYFVLFQNQLYKEAAMLLVHEIRDMDRAFELANWLDTPEIWQVLGKGLADYIHQSPSFKQIFFYIYQNPKLKLP